MQQWVRFEHGNVPPVGTLDPKPILPVHAGNLFDDPRPTGGTVPLAAVRVLPPAAPSKLIGLWNSFHALAEKQGTPPPSEPLYFLKAPSSVIGHGAPIRRPSGYDGRVVYEGELGVVIGRRVHDADETTVGSWEGGLKQKGRTRRARVTRRQDGWPGIEHTF